MRWLIQTICLLVLTVYSSSAAWAVYGFDPSKISLVSIIQGLLDNDSTITISPQKTCVPFEKIIELKVPEFQYISADIDWEVISGEGRIVDYDDGTADYFAPFRSSLPGSATIRAYLAAEPGIKAEITIDYGACADVGIFYRFTGGYLQPGIDPGCGTANEGSESFELTNDELGEGSDPEIPLSNPLQPEEKFSINRTLEGLGPRGTPAIGGDCALGDFPTDLRNSSTLSLDANGETVNYNVDLEARAVCSTFSDGQPGCSSANTETVVTTVYEFEVVGDATYSLKANLACASKSSTGLPNVYILVSRYDADGNIVRINDQELGIYIQRYCDSNNTLEFSREVHFSPPVLATHRAVVQFITTLSASADPERDGISERISTMDGSVQVFGLR